MGFTAPPYEGLPGLELHDVALAARLHRELPAGEVVEVMHAEKMLEYRVDIVNRIRPAPPLQTRFRRNE